jgi:hypothetical protein
MRRFSWSATLHVVLFLTFVGALLNLVNEVRRDMAPRQSLSVPVQALAVQAFAPALTPHLKPGAAFGGADTLFVYVAKPTNHQRTLDALTRYPLAVGSFVVFFLLWRLVAKARYAEPFTAGTVRRMRLLAGLVLVGGLLADIVTSHARDALVHTLADSKVWAADADPRFSWLLPGLALLAGAEIVRIGQQMRAELAEVI